MLPTQYLRDLITIPYFFEAQSEFATQKKEPLSFEEEITRNN